MKSIAPEIIKKYQENTFRTELSRRLKSLEEAIDYVNERGFIFFYPIRKFPFPSLWTATAGDRPVPDKHDDPGHITWRWKDSMLGSQEWYYAKALCKKACMISMNILPYFYALSHNYGSPEDDHIILYEQGKLTQEGRQIYQVLLDEGPLNTIALKKATHLSNSDQEGRFNKAMVDLQSDFKILPIGVSEAGPWRYAFKYEITARYYPDLLEKSAIINELSAIERLLDCYLQALGIEKVNNIQRFFRWKNDILIKGVNLLLESQVVQDNYQIEGDGALFIAHKDFLNKFL